MNLENSIQGSDRYKLEFVGIECPVLKSNCIKLIADLDWSPAIIAAISAGEHGKASKIISDEFDSDSKFLNLYEKHATQMKSKFKLTTEEVDETVSLLEGLALSYVGMFNINFMRPVMKELHANFVALDNKLGKMIDGLEESLEDFENVLNMISGDRVTTKKYKSAFEKLVASRNELKSLPEFVRQAPFASVTEFDKAAKPTNWPLYLWTEAVYSIWSGILGRTIMNSNDGINGRKHLLEFMDFCIRPVHETVEFESLDNMLRKVQNEIKKDGELSAACFKLGSSSPFGGMWSKSES